MTGTCTTCGAVAPLHLMHVRRAQAGTGHGPGSKLMQLCARCYRAWWEQEEEAAIVGERNRRADWPAAQQRRR